MSIWLKAVWAGGPALPAPGAHAQEAGAIRGYHAELDAATLGYPITVFAMVSLRSQAEHDLAAFEIMSLQIPEIRECRMLNGRDRLHPEDRRDADLKSFRKS